MNRPAAGVAVVGAWAVAVVATSAWGRALVRQGDRLHLTSGLFVGRLKLQIGWSIVVPVLVAGLLVALWPRACRTLRWRALLACSGLAGLLWAVSLAATRGLAALAAPLATDYEYLAALDDVERVGSLPAFLSGFVRHLDDLPIHVQGHPPGMVSALWLAERVGLGGANAAAAAVLVVGAAAGPLALGALRRWSDEPTARRAAPFVGLSPAVVWMATSTDALYCGLAAVAIALGVAAARPAPRCSGRLAALAAGLAAGALVLGTYGAPLLLAPALAPAWLLARSRRWGTLALAGAGLASVVLAFGAAGFWWWEGLAATRTAYFAGVGGRRPYGFFAVANLVVLAVSCGPAVVVGLTRLRDGRVFALVGLTLGAVLAADLSGMSKGEVERIWLPFVPWIALATVSLSPGVQAARVGDPGAGAQTARAGDSGVGDAGDDRTPGERSMGERVPGDGAVRGWLALQLAVALGLQLFLRSPW